jgi:hypothetical protein
MKLSDLILPAVLIGGFYFFTKNTKAQPENITGTNSQIAGQIPNTTINFSTGYQDMLDRIQQNTGQTSQQIITQARTQDLGNITVAHAPIISSPQAAAAATILTSAYNNGYFVPSSVLAGTPTAIDIQIARNRLASGRY